MSRSPRNLERLRTEQPNRASANLDLKSSLEIVRIMNREDAKVAGAVKRALPQIARAVDQIVESLRLGGRLIYVGAGTSGRIAALDAVECPPTFSIHPKKVQFVMAGGTKALGAAVEANEDSRELGQKAIAKKNPREHDVVVGVAASGRTPFTIAAIQYARRRGAKTVAVTCNRNSPLERAAGLGIVTEVGPEVVSGSTRMKSGTAQKMVLNMLSTAAMVRLGFVYSNLMVNVRPKNVKLTERAVSMLEKAVPMGREAAQRALRKAGNSVPVAWVMSKANVDRAAAERALKTARGSVRKAIAYATR